MPVAHRTYLDRRDAGRQLAPLLEKWKAGGPVVFAFAWLGLIILTGSAVTFLAYEEAFISVWCFFAAAASIVIALHFRRQAAVRVTS